MGQRVKHKRNSDLIYRSRQANRTDIEELLAPNFDPNRAGNVAGTALSDELPQATDSRAASTLLSVGSQLPESKLLSGSRLLPDTDLSGGASSEATTSLPRPESSPDLQTSDSRLLPGRNLPPDSNLRSPAAVPQRSHPGWRDPKPERGDGLQSVSTLLSGSNLLPDSSLLPSSSLPSILIREPSESPSASGAGPVRAETGSPAAPATRSLTAGDQEAETRRAVSKQANATHRGALLPKNLLRTGNGRIIQVREVRSVQDAHTKGEHELLKEMWKRGREESSNSRLLKAGLSELSLMCGSHKTSCRSYIRALIDKLAIEEVETYQAAAGLQGARVYRIYSFDEIRRRRRQAGLTHVIRTGAVVFVDPHTGVQLQTRRRSSPSESRLLPGSSLPSGGKFIPQPSSNLLDTPDSNLLPFSINNLEQQNVITSPTSEPPSSLEETVNELERLILQSPYSDFDRQAIIGIVKQSRERVPDITADEIFTLFQDKARSLIGNRRIENFNGMLIWAWNGFFSESRVNSLREAIRREKEQEQKRHEETIAMYRQFVNDASMPEEWREEARRYLATEGLLPGS